MPRYETHHCLVREQSRGRQLLMGLIVLAGLVSLPQIPMKSFPDIDLPMISISVAYLGAAPEEVEEGVCVRIEEELEGIEGVKEIRSSANEGLCTVQVEILESADESKALDDVKNRIDAIDTFPEETEKPTVTLVTPIRNVLDLAITGPADERVLKELAFQVRDDIAQLPGVTQVSVSNTRPYEISIEVSESSLRRNGLTFDQVAAAVRSGSLDLPGGSIKTIAGEILLRTKGQAYWGQEYESLVVTTRPDGTRLYLKDVARVVDGFADTDQALRFNDKPAALIRVGRMGQQDLQDISTQVKTYIEDVAPRLPEGMGQLEGAIEGAQRVAIPVTFGVLTSVATFMPLIFGIGFMGQVMGVIALTVICCLVFSLIESQMVLPAHLGHTRVQTPSGEVGMMLLPIVGIVLLGFAWDTRSYVALAIATGSLFLALHYAGLFAPVADRLIALQGRFASGLEALIHNQFRRAVEIAVAARYVTAAVAFVALLSAVAILISGRLPFSFFPPLASDQVVAKLTMPLGTSATVTDQAVRQLEMSAKEIKRRLNQEYASAPPAVHIMAAVGDHPTAAGGPPGSQSGSTGTAKSHLGEVVLQLTPSETRDINTRTVADLWREANGPIAEAVELKFNSSLFSAGNDIDIQLEGDNVEELRVLAGKLRLKLAEYPGVVDITDSFRSGKQELKLSILPSGESLGLSLGSLARQVRQAFYGEEAQRIQRGRDDVRVMVRYTQQERSTLGALDTMRIRTPDGSQVPFATVAEAELGRGFSSIRRADSRRVVNVIADVDRTQITANEVLADLRGGPMQAIMADHPRVGFSLEGAQADQSESLGSLLPLYVTALFVIFTLLAIPLRSYALPLIIMSVIPFAFVGAIWGHAIMKYFGFVSGLAMMSILGFVAASGVVVNSSLVLVHGVNHRRLQGESMLDAVIHASVSRCRPILLTSLTTFVGLSPLMLNKSVQAQFLVPMAVSLSFGVLFSTVVTLLVVPSGYLILDDLANLAKRLKPQAPVLAK